MKPEMAAAAIIYTTAAVSSGVSWLFFRAALRDPRWLMAGYVSTLAAFICYAAAALYLWFAS